MPRYLRNYQPGGTFFFTAVSHQRRPIWTDQFARDCLRDAIQKIRLKLPFELIAVVLLPDHLHTVWLLPENDTAYSTRWRCIKETFTRAFLSGGGREGTLSPSRRRHRERAVWQRRFWEHLIRDEADYARHVEYCYINPIKHRLVRRVQDWPYFSLRLRWSLKS